MEKLIIVGIGTNGRHAFEFIKDYQLYDVIGFAVDRQFLNDNSSFKGLPVYAIEDLQEKFSRDSVKLFVALLWNRLNADRKELFERLSAGGWQFANIISPYARIRGRIEGCNVWVHDNVVIQNDTVIMDDVSIMGMTLVGANCTIRKHVFLGAKSTIGGGSIVGEQTFVGMNCTVFDNTIVGAKCILGACTAVKRNVPDCCVIKTSSVIEMKQYSEEEIENKLLYRKNVR